MEPAEKAKFEAIITNGFQSLIRDRPNGPLVEFIFYLYSHMGESFKTKNKILYDFCEKMLAEKVNSVKKGNGKTDPGFQRSRKKQRRKR